MPLNPVFRLLLALCAGAALSGCSTAPFQVEGSDASLASAKAQAGDKLPRLQPRAYGVCHSSAFNEPEDVEAEAVYLCEGGRIERLDEDFFWNGCSLTQPHRISYVCHPADKAKRPSGEGTKSGS
jgi:hypothetical protein